MVNSPVNRFPEIPRQENLIFDQAIRRVFHHEGFYSNDPHDPGGATKYGISLRLARSLGDLDGDGFLDLDLDKDGDVDAADIKSLSVQQAIDVYRNIFWSPYPYDKLPPTIAVKVFDLAVNMGSPQAHKILQRAIRAASAIDAVREDGVLGPITTKAVNRQQPIVILAALRSEAAGFYRELSARRPSSAKYLKGWLNRAYD